MDEFAELSQVLVQVTLQLSVQEVIVAQFILVAVAAHNAGVVNEGESKLAFSVSSSAKALCTSAEDIHQVGTNVTAEAQIEVGTHQGKDVTVL